jgi:hypothetical protein
MGAQEDLAQLGKFFHLFGAASPSLEKGIPEAVRALCRPPDEPKSKVLSIHQRCTIAALYGWPKEASFHL